MRAATCLIACLVLVLAQQAHAQTTPFRVVASFSILGDLVQQIGGKDVSVRTLVGPNEDTHVYEPTPSDARSVRQAQMVVLNGLGFEGWMPRLLDAAQFHGTTVIATRGVPARRIEGHPDPHAWQDPRNVVIYVANIAAALAAALPQDAAQIRQRQAHYRALLEALDREVRAEFAQIPPQRRRIITTHDAFGYYGAAYGVTFLPAEGWTTDSEPTPAAVLRLVQQARAGKVTAVFLENITDPRMMIQLAHDTGLTVGGQLQSDALAPPGQPAATYLGMIRYNTDALLRAMRSPAPGLKHRVP